MSEVSRYSDASLLESIRGLSILYDHYIIESDKIISLSIDSKLLPHYTRIFLIQNVRFENLSITENILLINTQRYVYISIHQYLIYSIVHT